MNQNNTETTTICKINFPEEKIKAILQSVVCDWMSAHRYIYIC